MTTSMSDTIQPPKIAVRCPKCNRFMFNITITLDEMPVGGFGKIEDFKCPNRRCNYTSMVIMGVADKDKRGDIKKIEDELREQMKD